MIYKNGKFVKIKKELNIYNWYTNKVLKIEGFDNHNLYFVNHKFHITGNKIHKDFIYQDEECLKLNRENKLKRILK